MFMETMAARANQDQRQFARAGLFWSGNLAWEDDKVDCLILDMSASGARVKIKRPLRSRRDLAFWVPRFGEFRSDVMWRDGNVIGLKFHQDPQQVSEAIGNVLPQCRLAS